VERALVILARRAKHEVNHHSQTPTGAEAIQRARRLKVVVAGLRNARPPLCRKGLLAWPHPGDGLGFFQVATAGCPALAAAWAWSA